jgi:flavin-dependent dehydrogenase
VNVNAGSRLLVVGGGPVGLATAIEGRLAGLEVTVIERRGNPIDKACGEGLMPGTLAALGHWKVDPAGHRIAGIAYVDAGRRVEHRFRGNDGRGVRRTVLQDALSDRARGLGVEFVSGRAIALEERGGEIRVRGEDFGELAGDWLAGCDGLHSTVRRLAGLEPPRAPGRDSGVRRSRARVRFGVRRHFGIEPWSDLVEVYWGPRAELYVTPVDAETVGVAVLGPGPIDFPRVLASVPELADRLGDALPVSDLRGAGPLRQSALRRTAGRVLLVGDASGYVDALTGEGLRVGFAQARAAVRSVIDGDPCSYERAWARATRDARAITSGLVRAAGSPIRGAIVPAAVRNPRVFGAIVERLAR